MGDLRSKTISGVLWNSVDLFGSQVMQFIVVMVVARILTPEHYGLVGMLSVFSSVARIFISGGFTQALIRKKNTTQDDLSTVFYFNLFVAALLYSALFIASPYIAAFYAEPDLTDLARVLFLTLIFDSLRIVQMSILVKKVNFKTTAQINLIVGACSGALGVVMALNGYGVWTLVIQRVVDSALAGVVAFIYQRWIPSWVFSRAAFRELFGFGSKMMVSNLLNEVYVNLTQLLIGKFYSPADLGNYSQAKKFQMLPINSVTGVIQSVTYPVLAEMQDDDERLKRSYRRIIGLIAFICIPLMAGLAVMAENLIVTLLTEKWRTAGVYLRYLSFIGMLYPLSAVNLNILKVKGRSDLYLRLELIKKAIGLLFMAVTIWYGVMALIIGQLIGGVIGFALNIAYSGGVIRYTVREQLLDLLPYCLLALACSASMLPAEWFGLSIPAVTAVQTVTGLLVYAAGAHLFKLEAYEELRTIVRERLLAFKAR